MLSTLTFSIKTPAAQAAEAGVATLMGGEMMALEANCAATSATRQLPHYP